MGYDGTAPEARFPRTPIARMSVIFSASIPGPDAIRSSNCAAYRQSMATWTRITQNPGIEIHVLTT